MITDETGEATAEEHLGDGIRRVGCRRTHPDREAGVGLNFGEHDDVVFDHAPLVTVLCQVRFPPVLSLMTAAGIAGFQTALREEYPTLLPPERSASLELGPQSVGVEASAPVWKLRDASGQWTVGLAVDFISLESPSYTNIDDFLTRFGRVLRVLRRTVRPAESLRVGLRKVNFIQAPDPRQTASFLGIVRSELLGPLGVEQFPAPIGGYFSQLEFVDQDNVLVVRYGLQVQQDKPGFMLDMDYFTERPTEVGDAPSLMELLRHFSDGMTSFFHWGLDDRHKPKLGPRSRSEVEGR